MRSPAQLHCSLAHVLRRLALVAAVSFIAGACSCEASLSASDPENDGGPTDGGAARPADGGEGAPTTDADLADAAAPTQTDSPSLGLLGVHPSNRVLNLIEGVASESPSMELRILGSVDGVSESGWSVTALAMLQDSTTTGTEIAAFLRSQPLQLQPQQQSVEMRLEVDAAAQALSAGHYRMTPILALCSSRLAPDSLSALREDLENDAPCIFAFGTALGVEVLDEGADAVAGYALAIESGDPSTFHRALSSLVNHHRLRGQFDLALQAVDDALTATEGVSGIALAHPIYAYWNADTLYQAGDVDGAVALLQRLIDEAETNQGFLGEPYAARLMLELARMQYAERRHREAAETYDRLLIAFPEIHQPTVRLERASAKLYAQQTDAATEDYRAVVEAGQSCPDSVRGFVVCPTPEQVWLARRRLGVLEGTRSDVVEAPQALIEAFEHAVAEGDVSVLDRFAPPDGLIYTRSAGEGVFVSWENLVKPFLEGILDSSRELSLRVQAPQATRQVLMLQGLDASLGAGHADSVGIQLARSPLGWRWKGLSGVAMVLPELSGDCSDGAPLPCVPHELLPPTDGGVPPPTPQPPTRPNQLAVKAPWPPGEYMRAGGIENQGDFVLTGVESLIDLIIPTSDECGAGIPGFHYGYQTHVGADHFALDFTRGRTTGWCVWGICLSPSAIWDHLFQEVTTLYGAMDMSPAYDTPVLVARDGILIERISMYVDGDPDNHNSAHVGVWSQGSPAEGTIPALVANFEASRSLGEKLDAGGYDFWLRHLHNRLACPGCASVGMWVPAGQRIALIDDTGESVVSHLHFVVRRRPLSGVSNPGNWMSTPQIMEGIAIDDSHNGLCIRSSNHINVVDGDGDLIPDPVDNCLSVDNADQEDLDSDGVGDVCDDDRDNDGTPNDDDPCPDTLDTDHLDFDGDGVLDSCDPDIDGDGVPNEIDLCPSGDDAADLDIDGEPDACDQDMDGDGVGQECDAILFQFCGCVTDLAPMDDSAAGDHDGDGTDTLTDICPCDHYNEGCADIGGEPPVGKITLTDLNQLSGPSGVDPFGPGPPGPGGYIP